MEVLIIRRDHQRRADPSSWSLLAAGEGNAARRLVAAAAPLTGPPSLCATAGAFQKSGHQGRLRTREATPGQAHHGSAGSSGSLSSSPGTWDSRHWEHMFLFFVGRTYFHTVAPP